MNDALAFDRNFDPRHDEAVVVAPGVRRITAGNEGPFTFRGTNSYLIGTGSLALIDPGPADEAHAAALMKATSGERITDIIVTHTHRDHSEGAALIKERTGASTHGGGPHRLSRPASEGESALVEASADTRFQPDHLLADGTTVEGDGWRLEAIATPGHTANHFALAMPAGAIVFTGDHIMAWSTTVVAPPDGSMTDYMASLERMNGRAETTYLPGHGGPAIDGPAYARALRNHRLMREAAILERLKRGDRTIPAIVATVYRDTDPRLHGAAGLSVLAHLEALIAQGRVRSEGEPGIGARFLPA